ncbi:polyprenyl synthetase family protein [Candidatus Desulfosporosinus nitrosoreducens]|uniref:polyprenyl synthetase family protein n=1 Tax=Candidatus Desulfosporosinus nitrosoreducens TaxID=3401928 RepID=UPI00280AEF7B|nr:polyprenyl synthetase family protein [Desulfosporosinus sp. PR]
MTHHLDCEITSILNDILNRAYLSPEMMHLIQSSLNAEVKNGEQFKWAHLTILGCECVSGVNEVLLPGAVAMELAALAADIFDDIQDQDNDNLPWRQIPTANALNLAICLSMLSYRSLSMLSDNTDNRLYKEVSQMLSHMWITASDGQFQEVLLDNSEQVILDQYFKLVEKKSGSLTSCACKLGAILGGASEELVIQLGSFGNYLGIMGQIRNDLNDFLSLEKKRDFVNHKKTLPYVYLLNVLKGNSAEQFNKLTQLQANGLQGFGKEEQDYLKQLAMDEGVTLYCRVMYEMFREKAMEIIQTMLISEKHKEKLIKLVEENNLATGI